MWRRDYNKEGRKGGDPVRSQSDLQDFGGREGCRKHAEGTGVDPTPGTGDIHWEDKSP